MKAIILYFSGTGNTLYVVKKIEKILRKRNCITEVHSIEENFSIQPNEIDMLILGCPKYYEYPVIDFLKYVKENLPVSQKAIPTMMFCTQVAHLNTNFNEMERILSKKNYKLFVTKSFPIANNMVIFDSFPSTKPERLKENLDKVDANLKPLLTSLMTGQVNKEKTSKVMGMACYVSGYLFTKVFPQFAMKYTTSDACTGCGLCAKKCPKKNIRLQAKQPKFGKECIFCMRCINICPSNAILYKNKQCNQYKAPHNSDINF